MQSVAKHDVLIILTQAAFCKTFAASCSYLQWLPVP